MQNRESALELHPETRSLHQAEGLQEEEASPVSQYDLLDRVCSPPAGAASAESHASVLSRATDSRPSRAGQCLLQLQRQYGNRYVQRVLDLARKAAGEAEASSGVEQATGIHVRRGGTERNDKLRRQPFVEEEEEEDILQAKEISGYTPQVSSDVAAQINGLRGRGQPLSESIRAFFEPRFGYDLSQVKIHTDTEAHKLTRDVGAKAFTTGQDIFFGRGSYDPASNAGEKLLAHELIHVAQQSQSPTASPVRITDSSEPAEVEADAVANGWTNSREISIGPRPEIAGAIARVETPLPVLRHNWERVALLMQQSYEQTRGTLGWTLGRTPQPTPRGPFLPLDQAEAIIRRDRDDDNFPSGVRNAVDQVLRYIALIRINTEVRLHGGLRSDYMLRLVEELESRSRSGRIFPGESGWALGRRRWWDTMPVLISGGARAFRRWRESGDQVGSETYEQSEGYFTLACSQARQLYNEIRSQEDYRFAVPRAMIFDIIRRLEQILAQMLSHRSSERQTEDPVGRVYYQRLFPFWVRVYHALEGREFISPGEAFPESSEQESSGT